MRNLNPRTMTRTDRVWEDMQTAQVEVMRINSMLGTMDVDDPRFNELTEAHTRAIEHRAVAEAMWHVLVQKRRKARNS